jgi:hypothetical protein
VGLSGGFAAQVQRKALQVESAAPHPVARFERTFDVSQFQRGNLHTHTTASDGASTPENTILWYQSHGYQFLALTDHNVLLHPERYAALQEPGFVLVPGEEVTMTGNGRQVHVNALCTSTRIPGGAFPTAAVALASAIRRVAAQGGVAVVNHPNFDWALSADDVIDARDAPLLEIASGHPYVHQSGDALHPSHEQLWDHALAAGAAYMGVAVDDVHRVDVSGTPLALPGKAWVEVFGGLGDVKSICAALARGELYSSTGVELRRIAVNASEYVVEPARPDVGVTFIGSGGRELARVAPRVARGAVSYTVTGGEGYVRARIDSADGKHAWTPAVRVELHASSTGS